MLNGIELVQSRNGKIVTTSLRVAEVFGKKHKDVLESIDNLVKGLAEFSAYSNSPTFYKSLYENENNKQKYRMYFMDFQAFTLLTMGFNGSKALEFKLKYINEFTIMEKELLKLNVSSYMIEDPVKRAEKWIEEQKEKQFLSLQLEEQKPKVLLAESIENSNSLILIGELAKILKQNGVEIGQNRLFERLRDMGYLVKSGTSKNLPTQRSMDLELFRITEGTRTGSEGTKITKTTKVTGKGQSYFVNKFLKEVK